MPRVEWKPEYSVGIEAFDNDHRRLFALLNQVFISVASRKGNLALNHILSELAFYAQTHFREEEALMQRYGYPELASHRAMHDYFTAQIAQFSGHYESGQERLIIEVCGALQHWLAQHVLQCDAAYARYFRLTDGADLPSSK